ncbi:flagellin N-terminal helical domain-containing protein [Rossellomorea vietnamensis]|uniref:flagellin N-terminal helical domain-containing protein n=1 Tax=Rossellomorea vietnamensis TaxID=218284 RepID=UPI0009ED13FC|nr:flagellin [Rossellomorea vietnamensis]
MRINHNIAALNTYRQLNSASTAQGKSMEKLSSGLRINRAGDDAAGLAISEKMRGQIRGLDQASRNSQDGISMIQTAEGALNETHDILQRMRELAVQAGNSTNTADDRKEIQNEVNQLTSEINRVGNTTEFNTQKLLNGGETTGKLNNFTIGTQSIQSATAEGSADFGGTTGSVTASAVTDGDTTLNGYKIKFAKSGTAADPLAATINTGTKEITVAWGDTNKPASWADVNTAIKAATDLEPTITTDVTLTAGTFAEGDLDTKQISLSGGVTEQLGSSSFTISNNLVAGETITISGQQFTAVKGTADASRGQFSIDTSTDAAATSLAAAIDANSTLAGRFDAAGAVGSTITLTESSGQATGVDLAKPSVGSNLGFKSDLQIGANTEQSFTVQVDDMRALALGITGGAAGTVTVDGKTASYTSSLKVTDGTNSTGSEAALDVSTHENATAAITVIDSAIKTVSSERSKLGSYQNRLEHTINNLNTSSENLTAAESRIRDVDYALAA